MNLLLACAYLFLLNRFGGIEIKPDSVRFYQGNKQGEQTVYQSQLLTKAPDVFITPQGVEFRIEKLTKPVIHDKNRGINSGEYRLWISGSGEAYDKVVAKIPHLADFAATGEEMVFYGQRSCGLP
jgi:hypothetical protein